MKLKKDSVLIIVLSVVAVLLVSFTAYIFIARPASKDSSAKAKQEKEIEEKEETEVTEFAFLKLKFVDEKKKTSSEFTVFAKGDACEVTWDEYIAPTNHPVYEGGINTPYMIQILNSCDVLSWDGLETEKTHKYFEFDAKVNGRTIHAEGSQDDCPEKMDVLTAMLKNFTTMIVF